jgi:single-stranded DNA-binding protein
MATINTRNHGVATGRLTKDVVTFENKGGSKKHVVTLALRDNFKNKDGEVGAQFVDFTGFVAKDASAPVYDLIHEGDLVTIVYELRNDNWTDENDERHFDVQLRITGIDMLESKATTTARAKGRAKK